MITVAHLTKSYARRTVVDDLSFELTSGRITGFVGPNGAGKSTTMRMMVGLARPDAGEVTYRGTSYTDLRDPARTVGVVLDARAVHPRPNGPQPPPGDGRPQLDPREPRRRDAAPRRPRRRGRSARRRVLTRHAPASRHRRSAARRPGGAHARRAGQRSRPRRHPVAAHDAHRLRRGRRHGVRVEPTSSPSSPPSPTTWWSSATGASSRPNPWPTPSTATGRSASRTSSSTSPAAPPATRPSEHTAPDMTSTGVPMNTTISLPTTVAPAPILRDVRAAVRSEWIKLRSVRATPTFVGVSATFGVGMALILGRVLETDPYDHLPFTIANTFLVSSWLTTLFAVVAGTMLFTSEVAARHARRVRSPRGPRGRRSSGPRVLLAAVLGLAMGAGRHRRQPRRRRRERDGHRGDMSGAASGAAWALVLTTLAPVLRPRASACSCGTALPRGHDGPGVGRSRSRPSCGVWRLPPCPGCCPSPPPTGCSVPARPADTPETLAAAFGQHPERSRDRRVGRRHRHHRHRPADAAGRVMGPVRRLADRYLPQVLRRPGDLERRIVAPGARGHLAGARPHRAAGDRLSAWRVALQFLPLLVLGAPAGVLADRVDVRRLLMATSAVSRQRSPWRSA